VDADDQRWYRVSLRLIGDALPEPQEVEALLRLPTSFCGRKGRHIRDNPRYAIYPTNIWGWDITCDPAIPFEDQLEGALDMLESRFAELRRLLALPGVQARLVLGFGSESGQGGAWFEAGTLARIARLGLGLDIHLYPPEDIAPRPKPESVILN
jgi:hypothetical protein